jgi:F0F1-type ATP synthase membrane subunit b/b'
LGRGCVVKVTKTNTDGGILSIQVIRFGLDYKTKFYSYLSSKGYEAFEYAHPLKLHPSYIGDANNIPPNDPAYNERSGGFIDYGFSSKQTYMFYDEEIPVGTPERRSDRYFVDGTYVGEIQSQFYADASAELIDEDLAIIEIELGAVAKYPGYYLNADGFISDEMYIHDGNYYQAFSYVIKVEEELKAYADIVRALVHPAGMKLFAEYSIYRELKLEFTRTLIRTAIQLPFEGSPPSNGNAFDAGFNYNAYVLENGEYVPAPDAGLVFSRQSKAALFMLKQLEDITPDLVDFIAKFVNKNINSDQLQVSQQSKNVIKPILDILDQYIDSVVKNVAKNINSNQTQLSLQAKSVTKSLVDTQQQLSLQSKLVTKPIIESISNADNNVKHYFKNQENSQLALDANAKDVIKPLTELQQNTDNTAKQVSKPIESVLIEYISIVVKNVLKNINDAQNLQSLIQTKNTNKQIDLLVNPISQTSKGFQTLANDSTILFSLLSNNDLMKNFVSDFSVETTNVSPVLSKGFLEEIQALINKPTFVFSALKQEFPEAISFTSKLYNKILTGDSISTEDALRFSRLVQFFDTIEIIDSSLNSFTKNLEELQNSIDVLTKFANKNIFDTQGQISSINKLVSKNISSVYSGIIESAVLSNAKTFSTLQNLTDQQAKNFAKTLESVYQGVTDLSLITPNKLPQDAINTSMNGRIKLSSEVYDSEDYYEVFEDFQPLTQLS